MFDPRALWRAAGFLLFLIAGAACAPPPTPTETLLPGQAVTQRVWSKDFRSVFEGEAGEVITLRVTSQTPGLDPRVSLFDPEDVEEASDDDGGGHGNSLIQEHTLKRTGVYTVLVGSDGKVEGKVEVLLEKAPPSSR